MVYIFSVICINQISAQAPSIQWQKSYGGSSRDEMQIGSKIIQTSDGGYIMAGFTESGDGDVTGVHANRDYWIVKTDASGNLQWQKTYGGSNRDYARSIDQTTDGGYIVAGVTESNDGDVIGNHSIAHADMWVLKLDATGNLQWQKTYGGTANDFANSIQQTTDGGYVIFGTTFSVNTGDVSGFHGFSDYWAVKTDASGNIQWQKAYGGTEIEEGLAIQSTNDGGYIMTGFTSSSNDDITFNHGSYDFWVVKADAVGNLQWQKTYGGSDQDIGHDIMQTVDGGYIIAGNTWSTDGDITFKQASTDYWVVKTDVAGNLQWQKTYGGNSEDYAYSIKQTTDGGFIISGYTLSSLGDVTGYHGGSDSWVVKTNGSGTLQWQKALGGTANEFSYGIQQTTDGGYIVSCNAQSNDGDVSGNHGSYDFWLVKLAANCNQSVSAGSDETLYFGYGPQQCKSKTVTITGGTGPYTYSWTLDRPLLSNIVTPNGDEVMTGSNTNTVSICLLDTAILCITVTDAIGCTASDCVTIYAEDVRCFAGNSGVQKVRLCHNNNSICVDSSAVQSHLNHGDELGPCSVSALNSGNILQEQNSKPKMLVYSNGSNISIQLNLDISENKNAIIQVLSINGQLIQKINTAGRNNLEINTNSKGIYIVQLITGKEKVQKKILVN